MPKELFRGTRAPNGAVSLDLTIGWGRDLAEVQIGLVMPEPESDSAPKTIWDMISQWSQQDREYFDSLWFTTYRWSDVNRMVAKLKTARDQSFGRPA